MPVFKPCDSVTHLYTKEEGIIKSVHVLRTGTNAYECLLVTVGKEDKVWLCDETAILDSTNRK